MSSIVAAALLELLVLVVLGEQSKFPRHVVEAPWGLRYNTPGARYRHKSADGTWRFRINAQGMRADRDYAYEKPPGVRRIISLGDSFTIGYEVDLEQCFSSVLEQRLRAAGLDVEVLNCGVSGFSTAEECLYLERELLRYDPDLVLVSFFGNDLTDNVRTGLFALEDETLVHRSDRFIPSGWLGNVLNTNWLFGILSERSNAFALVKERATRVIKRIMERRRPRTPEPMPAIASDAEAPAESRTGNAEAAAEGHRKRLAAAILERMYGMLHDRGIPLVIQSIPNRRPFNREMPLEEEFPLDLFDVDRPGLVFVPARHVLEHHVGETLLHRERSHGHWTPFSHRMAGEALATAIMEQWSGPP